MASRNSKNKSSKNSSSESWREIFITINKVDVNYLKARAAEGSQVAAGVLDALTPCFRLLDFLDRKEGIHESEWVRVVSLAYDCFAQEYQIFNFPGEILDMLKNIVDLVYEQEPIKKGEFEMKARFCYVRFTSDNETEATSMDELCNMPPHGVKLLEQGVKLYPDNVHYYILLMGFYCCTPGHDQLALSCVKQGLEKFPNNATLLYFKATMLHMSFISSEQKRVDVIAAFQEFLSKAPQDHPSVPKAYYLMASSYVADLQSSNGKSMMNHFYKLGKEADKKMLPCYAALDECHDVRKAVEALIEFSITGNAQGLQKLKKQTSVNHQNGVVQRRTSHPMDNPVRKRLVISHRQLKNDMSGKQVTSNKPKLIQTFPKGMSRMKPITLKETSPTSADTIYQDRVIDLTIIDEPIVVVNVKKLQWIQVIAQDKNGDVTRLFIYNEEMSKDEAALDKFKFGCKIAIFNPYMQIREDEADAGIRNDEPRCIVHLDEIPNMCRCCGKREYNTLAQLKCIKCKKASYCSQECQQLDWKLLKHNLICLDL